MKFWKLENGSVPLGKMLLFGCITLGLMTALCAAAPAQGDVLTLIKMPLEDSSMNNYGELAYALPAQVNVTPDNLVVSEYTGGKEVAASIFLDGSKVALHLLYPCQAPQTLLDPEGLKSLLNAYEPVMMQANYSEELLGISGMPAIWGQLGGLIFAAYQPTNQTAAIITMDTALPEETMANFLGNFSITLNDGVTPLTAGYCPDTTVAPAAATVQDNAIPAQVEDKEMTPAEKMKADRDRIKATMDAAREAARKK